MLTLLGVFLVLHGLIHLVYAGHSARRFELKPGLIWPDESWALTRLLDAAATRRIATALMILITAAFLLGGLGLLLRQGWWRPLTQTAAVVSILAYLLLWDGSRTALDAQGGIGALLSLAALLAATYLSP